MHQLIGLDEPEWIEEIEEGLPILYCLSKASRVIIPESGYFETSSGGSAILVNGKVVRRGYEGGYVAYSGYFKAGDTIDVIGKPAHVIILVARVV